MRFLSGAAMLMNVATSRPLRCCLLPLQRTMDEGGGSVGQGEAPDGLHGHKAGGCRIVACYRLAAHPAAEEYDQQIVGRQSPAVIVAEHFVDVQEAAQLSLDAGLFPNFAQGGVPRRLALLNVAAG